MSDADLAASIPTEAAAVSAVGMFPVGLAETYHLLVLADDVTVEEVEALALSQDPDAGWIGASRLQVMAGATLQGPWPIDDDLRRLFDLPDWAAQVMILACDRSRAPALPEALVGTDPLLDAFPDTQPAGTELVALTRLRAIARRLAGAIRVADSGAVVVPDPDRSTAMTIYAPVWLTPDGAAHLLSAVAPGLGVQLDAPVPPGPARGLESLDEQAQEQLLATLGAERLEEAWRRVRELEAQTQDPGHEVLLDGYAVTAPVEEGRSGWGRVSVMVRGSELLPLAVQGEAWAGGGVIQFEVRWEPLDPADAYSEHVSRGRRHERRAAAGLIEALATALVGAVGGVVVDDDGFLIDLS